MHYSFQKKDTQWGILLFCIVLAFLEIRLENKSRKIQDIVLSPNFVKAFPLCWHQQISAVKLWRLPHLITLTQYFPLAKMRPTGSELQQQKWENKCSHCFSKKMLSSS